jgi:drug/metabolite transporter (DMT)-like permease
MNLNKKQESILILKLILVALFWGGTFIATRIATKTFEPFQGACLRFIIASALLLPLVWKRNNTFFKINFNQFLLLLALGLSGIFFYNYFFFKGLKMVEASHGALLVALNPSMVLIGTSIIYKEKITWLKTAGLVLSLLGVSLVISKGNIAGLFSSFELGDAFMLGCPFCWAIYTLLLKKVTDQGITRLVANAWASFAGCIMLGLFAIQEPIPVSIPFNAWIALAYLGIVGTVVSLLWYTEGIEKLGTTRTATFTNLVPVFALLLSVLILKEQVPWYTYFGGALVIAGIYLVHSGAVKTINH